MTLLITGATDGIGLELARHYARESGGIAGGHFFAGRRHYSQIADPPFGPDAYCRCDLADAACADVIADFLDSRDVERLNLLVHNAGVGFFGDVAAQDEKKLRDLVGVNLIAPMTLTRRLLPQLRSGRGRIVLISSIVAALPCPNYEVYGATKAALDDFGRNLRLELRGSGVSVQVVRPGAVRTGMHAKSGIPAGMMKTEKFPPPDAVAREIAAQIAAGRTSTVVGGLNTLAWRLGRHLPGVADLLIARRAR